MDWKELLINQLVGLLSGFLLMPSGAKKYLKVIIRVRDYALLLCPLDTYPVGFKPENFGRTAEQLMIQPTIPAGTDASVGKKTGGARFDTRARGSRGTRHKTK